MYPGWCTLVVVPCLYILLPYTTLGTPVRHAATVHCYGGTAGVVREAPLTRTVTERAVSDTSVTACHPFHCWSFFPRV